MTRKAIDITGQIFTRLTVISRHKSNRSDAMWNCYCECGGTVIATGSHLRSGHTKSCGCYRSFSKTKHGMSNTKTHQCWARIKSRCYNAKDKAYKNYGGRGIFVCDRWRYSFENFFHDMGVCPVDRSIERIDNNLGYSPDNCKWASVTEQANNKRNNRLLTLNGITKTLPEWGRFLNISKAALYNRVYRGHNDHDVLTMRGRNQDWYLRNKSKT